MAPIKLELDQETYHALMQDASRNLRPTDWHIRAILRQYLGLAFPYPPESTAAGKETEEVHA